MRGLWKWAGRALSLLIPAADREFVCGDLEELHDARVREHGRIWADVAHLWDLFLSGLIRRFRRDSRSRVTAARVASALSTVLHDGREAFRSLRARPQLVVLSTAVLGIGVGAAGAVFGIVDQLVLRPVPGVADDQRLVFLEFDSEERPGVGIPWSHAEALRTSVEGFEGMAAYRSLTATVSAGESPVQVFGQFLFGSYFGVLGVQPAAGRLLTEDEMALYADPDVVVISEWLWSSQFGRDPAVVGRRVIINRRPLTVVGVAGGGFRGNDRLWPVDVWVPFSAMKTLETVPEDRLSSFGLQFFLARLARGVGAEPVEEELSALLARLPAIERPGQSRALVARVSPGTIDSGTRDYVARPVPLLLALVVMVLAITCANMANLLLTRGLRSRGDLAVRRSMGASRARLARILMWESLLLSGLGSALGVVVAIAIARVYAGQSLWLLPAFEAPVIDGRALGFASIIALLTAMLFGVLPAVAAGRFNLASHLGHAGRTATPRGGRAGRVLSSSQFGLSLALLVAGLMLGDHLRKTMSVDLGIEPTDVYATSVDVRPLWQEYPTDGALLAMHKRLLEAVRSERGVEGAVLADPPLYDNMRPRIRVVAPGVSEPEGEWMETRWVSPGWFEMMEVEVLSGRPFGDAEWNAAGPLKAVLTASLGRRLFGAAEAVGRVIQVGGRTLEEAEVVGVVEDTRVADPRSEPDQLVYLSHPRGLGSFVGVLVKGRLGEAPQPQGLVKPIRAVVPDIPVPDLVPLSSLVEASVSVPRVLTRLVNLLAVLAITVSAVGLYGVVALTTARRTREFAIRIAMGATPGAIARLVTGSAGAIVLLGLALGGLGAVWLAKLLRSQVFGVDVGGLGPFVLAALVMAVVAVAACWAPAFRASRTDPRPVLQGR